jgi:hypothetical protein
MQTGTLPAGHKIADLTADQTLQKLLRSTDESIRLRAAEKICARDERQITACPVCAARVEQPTIDLRLLLSEERAEFLSYLAPLKILKQRVRVRIAALTPADRMTILADATDDEVRGDPSAPNILGSDAPQPRKPRVFMKSDPDNPYEQERIRDAVTFEMDSSGQPIPGTATRTAAAVKIRSDELDAQAAAADAANLLNVQEQFTKKAQP